MPVRVQVAFKSIFLTHTHTHTRTYARAMCYFFTRDAEYFGEQMPFCHQITKELTRLQQMASNNKLSSEDITGGTITLSNIGTIGGKFGSPLLCLPEVAIIAMGRVQRLPRFADDGTVYPASVINVNIGADHRVLDGATVARFCNEWKLLIEKPELLLLRMR